MVFCRFASLDMNARSRGFLEAGAWFVKLQQALRYDSNLLFGGLAFIKILAEGQVGRREEMTACCSWQRFEVFLLKVPAERGCKSNPPGACCLFEGFWWHRGAWHRDGGAVTPNSAQGNWGTPLE